MKTPFIIIKQSKLSERKTCTLFFHTNAVEKKAVVKWESR